MNVCCDCIKVKCTKEGEIQKENTTNIKSHRTERANGLSQAVKFFVQWNFNTY